MCYFPLKCQHYYPPLLSMHNRSWNNMVQKLPFSSLGVGLEMQNPQLKLFGTRETTRLSINFKVLFFANWHHTKLCSFKTLSIVKENRKLLSSQASNTKNILNMMESIVIKSQITLTISVCLSSFYAFMLQSCNLSSLICQVFFTYEV